jgi:TolB-like protein
MSLAAGACLGPYEIRSLLGEGGMGQVWRARDTRLERDVALKVLPAGSLGDESARARLIREARLASKLNHPHICTIYDVGEDQGHTYIGMELVDGCSLSDRIARGAVPAGEVIRLGQQLAGALAHAHARGVVHRDFKSANVVVTPEGQVKVLDFGLAKRLFTDELSEAQTQSRQSLTDVGVTPGTLAYMAPEQLKGQPADARSDIWALGVVLYELLAGQRPFQGKTGFELSSAILNQPVPAVPASVPAPLAGVIDRCLAKEPGERYQRADEVRAALEAAAAGQTIAIATPLRGTAKVTRRLAATAAGLAVLAIVAALLLALDVGGVRSHVVAPAATPARIVRLAVLPFANVSGDAEQEYLSDGLTTEMIALLGRLHPESLQVIARTTAMRYKQTDKTIDQIGRELGVDYVLEGSAQREAGRVRITADLIKVADQAQVWADRYERELAGILALQNDVAQKVAAALALKLLPAEQARLAGARAVNPEAYDAYLKGTQYWTRLSPADLDTAERYFNLALEKDPRFAPAPAGLAMVWLARQQMGFAAPSEAGPKARSEARRALELDDTSAMAHFALATLLTYADWDFPAAGREWSRAIELDPGDALARANYSHYLMLVGRRDDAMTQIEAALKADPFNVIPRLFYGVDLVFLRRYEEALAAFREGLRMQPGNPLSIQGIWLTSARLGKEREAVESAREYPLLLYQGQRVAQACDDGYAHGGYREAMRRAAEALAALSRTTFALPSDVAWFYIEAGDKARALDWLEKGYEVRDPAMVYLGAGWYDGLRAEPRFQALLRKMNLPQ